MGLLDFFKKKSNKKSEILPNQLNTIDDLDTQREKIDQLKSENDRWQKDFNRLIYLRNEAALYEKSEQFHKAIEFYLKSLDFGENSENLDIHNYSHDIERIIILYNKTKNKESELRFLQKVIESYPQYRDVKKWAIRLTKLTGITKPNQNITHSDITKQIAANPTIGQQFEQLKNSLPEFNFYYDIPDDMQTFEYLHYKQIIPHNKARDLRNFRESFQVTLGKAKIAENEGNYKIAIEAYEKLIVEEFEDRQPYDRLMILYRKLNWKEQEVDTIKKAIYFFEDLKRKQRDKITTLAKKYGMESKAMEYINNDKKIQYFGGVFDLYNPNPAIEKWRIRLRSIE